MALVFHLLYPRRRHSTLLIFIKPYFSPLKDVPTAPQPPLRRRIFKEPNPFHFERWINTVPNQGLIRYFGFLNMERVLVTSPDAVRQILQQKPYDFEKQYAQRIHLSRLAGQGLVSAEGDVHKRQRKVMLPAFKHEFVNDWYGILRTKTCELAQVISNSVQKASDGDSNEQSLGEKTNSRVMDLDDFIHRAVFDVICMANIGYNINAINQPEGLYKKTHGYRMAFEPSPFDRLRAMLALMLPTWVINRLPTHSNRVMSKSIDEFLNLVQEL
jgi:cytochrome P450